MELYELVKKYYKGGGEDTMWRTLSIVSDAICESMPEDRKDAMLRNVYADMTGGHYDEEHAKADVEKMYYVDRRGATHPAPYWTVAQVNAIYDGVRSKIPAYSPWDFYVAMNMVAADNWCTLKEWFPSDNDDTFASRVAQMTLSWLDDPDSPYDESKVWRYLNPRA